LVGRPAPDFAMETVSGDGQDFGSVKLSDYRGKWLVFFFYPWISLLCAQLKLQL
jgi:alkyl hydroperoxide reductase subunit AhpC